MVEAKLISNRLVVRTLHHGKTFLWFQPPVFILNTKHTTISEDALSYMTGSSSLPQLVALIF